MPTTLYLEISGIALQICSRDINKFDFDDPAYDSFLTPGKNSPDITVHFQSGNLPQLHPSGVIFDSGESWLMYHDRDTYYIVNKPESFKRPIWVSQGNHDFTEITLCCDDSLSTEPTNDAAFSNPMRYPLDQIILMYYLSSRMGAILHAAGIELNGKGYIFAGRSGAGKTTISRQFALREYGSMLSDDRVIIRKIDDTLMVFGTPWPGEGGFAVNRGVPLDGIFFIAHSDANSIEAITSAVTIEKLLPVTSIPWYDPEPMSNILSFCDDLIAHIPCHILHFKPDAGVVDMFEKFVALAN